ncbi:hypothetical protein BC936DRAFT_138226 [Jimgerdemannia flammicorona]|uniref:Uncharacterized protein n=2 Tax=Jimgerdemannia flammicorona TaxID=994334 RepID=A0A433QI57_9FUNG|nr:hypothetical protein BC936DRAFT_138226 [Jimgerdemannia flammicorona]RUS29482.1 hypothetical protein BC938DRAFT_480614 [Jimgerdemannia flammicorona]
MDINAILDAYNNTGKDSDFLDRLYDVLGCVPSSTYEQIGAEYKRRVLECHPDKLTSQEDIDKEAGARSPWPSSFPAVQCRSDLLSYPTDSLPPTFYLLTHPNQPPAASTSYRRLTASSAIRKSVPDTTVGAPVGSTSRSGPGASWGRTHRPSTGNPPLPNSPSLTTPTILTSRTRHPRPRRTSARSW